MPIFFKIMNAKCTYFQPKIYLRGPKMYLVKNVLENLIWAVPLLLLLPVSASVYQELEPVRSVRTGCVPACR